MKDERQQRGQAMVLIALTVIGLAAFIGLVVDGGTLFIQYGHLRRAVDAASLSAANQFREGRPITEIEASAHEFIELNNLDGADANIFVCDLAAPGSIYDDPSLCPGGTNPPPFGSETPRKFIRVEAGMQVYFSFLRIIGWVSVPISAEAISETASVDVVLVIDTSPSMTYDAACDDVPPDDDDGDGVDNDCTGEPGGPDTFGPTPDNYFRTPANCNPTDDCQPFRDVRAAALALVDRLYFPYDRMAVVTFDRTLGAVLDLSEDKTAVQNFINGLQVTTQLPCPGYPPDPTGCPNTNIAEGLNAAGNQFATPPIREEAVWIVILLTDGAANAARTIGPPAIWICPGGPTGTWLKPFCRDEEFEVGDGQYGYDAEDAAEHAALFVGCPDALSPQPAGCVDGPGNAAVIFTIGLGDIVTNFQPCEHASCEPQQGEDLLRFIAAVGDDGDPGTDPCSGKPIGDSCGNYYFSPEGSGLMAVFEAIASRIFTRITH